MGLVVLLNKWLGVFLLVLVFLIFRVNIKVYKRRIFLFGFGCLLNFI